MAKKGSYNIASIKSVTSSMADLDRAGETEATAARRERGFVKLNQILDRTEDTRTLNQKHVEALAESIKALGLLEPLVTDEKCVLLAGGHRLAALRNLSEENLTLFGELFPLGVPVRRLSFNASIDEGRALAIEVAENEHRRDYTRAEALQIAERLRHAGYRDKAGRPKKGEKALAPALQTVMGKSLRTVRRLLSEASAPAKIHSKPNPPSTLRALQKAVGKYRGAHGRSRKGVLLEVNELTAALELSIKKALDELKEL